MFCANWAEADAISEGLTWARNKIFSNIAIESDCADIINRFRKLDDDITITGFVLRRLKTKVADFSSCTFSWCTPNSNRVADKLSKLALADHCNYSFDMDYPSSFHDDVFPIVVNKFCGGSWSKKKKKKICSG